MRRTPFHDLAAHTHAPLALLALALICAALLRPHAEAIAPAAADLTEAQREQVNMSPFGVLLGEVRTSMSDVMWVKTERYFHRGVAYEPHLNASEMSRSGKAVNEPQGEARNAEEEHDYDYEHEHEHEHEHAHGHEGDEQAHSDAHCSGRALVPAAKDDFRGFIGTLQRAVQPWQDENAPHEHGGGEELIPWYRLLTLSNPHHWRAYAIGTWWLMTRAKEQPEQAETIYEEADAFIREGIRNNPRVLQLPLTLGRLELQRGRSEAALGEFARAIALGDERREAAADAHQQRGEAAADLWTADDQEDWAAAIRYTVSVRWRLLGDPLGARLQWEQAIRLLPNDKPLRDLGQALTSELSAPAPVPQPITSKLLPRHFRL